MLSKEISRCIEDMQSAAAAGKITLQMQVRAYDLLGQILDLSHACVAGPAEEFREQYYTLETDLKAAYDEDQLKQQAREMIQPLTAALDAAAEKSRKATALHEAAKQTFEIWQNGGFFERNKALRNLRKMAGFRLESNRIGNYVAKTFDLMNEANSECARAQQALFAANVDYKIKPGVYAQIAAALQKGSAAGRMQ